MFNLRHLQHALQDERQLTGVDWNEAGQLRLLEQMNFAEEIKGRWDRTCQPPQFHIHSGGFEAGDAEYWYSIIRHFKPDLIIEIGSGNSTLVARLAIARNQAQDAGYRCQHVCIEPYEMPWLEATGVEVVRLDAWKMSIPRCSERWVATTSCSSTPRT